MRVSMTRYKGREELCPAVKVKTIVTSVETGYRRLDVMRFPAYSGVLIASHSLTRKTKSVLAITEGAARTVSYAEPDSDQQLAPAVCG